MIKGFATSEGTNKFAENHIHVPQQNYRKIQSLALSNVGIGTYLGKHRFRNRSAHEKML